MIEEECLLGEHFTKDCDLNHAVRLGHTSSLTAALVEYLRDRGVADVQVCGLPVVVYNHRTHSMISRKCPDVPMAEVFDYIYEHVKDEEYVIIYLCRRDYVYSGELDASYNPIGERRLTERTMVRYATASGSYDTTS